MKSTLTNLSRLFVLSLALVSCGDSLSMFEREKENTVVFSEDDIQLQKLNTDAYKEYQVLETNSGKGDRMATIQATLSETFESGTKTSYTAADVTLSSGVWNLNNALIGTTTSDRKNGTKSARVTSTGKLTMKFNRTTGAGVVSVKHAKYGTDANSTWELWQSTNSGSTWTKVGSTVTTSSTTLATANFTVNVAGTVRFEIRKLTGTSTRINFDDISITDYSTTPPPPTVTEVESNNSTTFANTVATPSSTSTGVISATTDVDYFKFTVTSGQVISLNATIPSGVDYDLYLVNSSSAQVASSENGIGAPESISYTATYSGTYYFAVQSFSGSSTTSIYSVALTVSTTTTPPPSSSVHLTFGNPSGAAADVAFPANYLMEKPQYAMSYHRDRGIPNWVSWHVDASWIGSAARQDDFRNDTSLPSGWYQVGGSSYSGSGFDRGHNCPSADRTKTVADNSATFLMTNMIPQAPDNNQGPWAALENYTRTLVTAGNEVYVIMGQYGVGGTGSNGAANTIDSGRITVPDRVWKVIIVIPSGSNDVSRVTTSTRVIAVDMPNDQGIRSNNWGTYRTTVNAIEATTGFDILSAINDTIEATLESTVDAGPTS